MSAPMAATRTSLMTRTGERRHARDLLDQIDGKVNSIQLEAGSKKATPVPPDLVTLIERVLQGVANGDAVTIEALPEELTTTQAASQLGISRPTVMKLINSGELPSHMVGTHHRVKTSDIAVFRRKRLEKQRTAFAELQALEEELEDY